jgi:murein DD-endopeptidase MepM/ murein hydrolase activator NlpD
MLTIRNLRLRFTFLVCLFLLSAWGEARAASRRSPRRSAKQASAPLKLVADCSTASRALGQAAPKLARFVAANKKRLFGPDTGACLPYVLGTGGRGVVVFAAANRASSDTARLAIVSQTATGQIATSSMEVSAPTVAAFTYSAAVSDALLGVPPDGIVADEGIAEETAGLVQAMVKLNGARFASAVTLDALVLYRPGDGQVIAASVTPRGATEPIEVFWYQRNGVSGAFVESSGRSYERYFWTNPLQFEYISRGLTRYVERKTVLVKRRRHGKTFFVKRRIAHRGYHRGVDFAAPTGTPVAAVAEGRVRYAEFNPSGYGNLVVLEHADGTETYYAHLSEFAAGITAGVEVRRGMTIGFVGSTGHSTGPHLHYEVRVGRRPINPFKGAMQSSLWDLKPRDYAPVAAQWLMLRTVLAHQAQSLAARAANAILVSRNP